MMGVPGRGPRRFVTAAFAAFFLSIVGLGTTVATAPAAHAEASSAALSTKELEALVKTLEDKGKREEFVKTLKAILKARQATTGKKSTGASGFLSGLSERAKQAAGDIFSAAGAMFSGGNFGKWFERQFTDETQRAKWLELVWKVLLILALGLLAEWVLRWLLRRPRAAVEDKETDTWPIKIVFLVARTFLDLLPIAAFAGAAYGILPLLDPSLGVRLIALTIIYASLLSRSIKAVARMVLVPRAEGLRLIPMSTETARYIFLWIRRFTTVGVYGYFIAEATLLFGLPEGGHGLLIKLLGLTLTIMAIVLILQNRREVGEWIVGEPDEDEAIGKSLRNVRERFADIWHILAILYVIAVFIVWVLGVEGGFVFLTRATVWTVVISVFAVVIVRLLDRAIARLFRVDEEMKEGAEGLEERANRYLPWVHKGLRVFVYLGAVLLIAQVWGADVLGWLTGPTGQKVVSSGLTIVFVLVAALVVWELISEGLERYLKRVERETEDTDRVKRLSTILPLVRNAILVALIVFVALIVLSELGVNIGPLLAGAGVLGLAIGFGAQTLVKDIITGLFILVEDTIKVGDSVEVAGKSGTVEGLTVRTITLRDLWGNLHTIPFSDISTVKNNSPDFAYYVFDIGVGYGEDVDYVISVLREIDEEMRADADWKKDILAPLDIWGLNSFGDSAIVIRARLKANSGRRYPLGREYNRRIKLKFDELGIEIPYPHTTVFFGEAKDGTAPPLQVRHQEGLPRPKKVAKPEIKEPPKPKRRRKKDEEDARSHFVDGDD